MRIIPLIAISLMVSACCTTEVVSDLPCPARPELAPLSADEQILIDPDTLSKIADNQLLLKTYAKQLEARGCQ